MTPELDWHAAKAMLQWQLEMGATEAIQDVPVDRYALGAPAGRKPAPQAAAPEPRAAAPEPVGADPVAVAEAAAGAATDLAGLEAALASFPFCDLRKGARSMVFADGRPDAGVMVIGEAPDRDQDRDGRPFRGAVEPLTGRMFAAIGLSRDAGAADEAVYLVSAIPWRLPGRAATPDEVAMLTPFLRRHVELAGPRVVLCMGALPCEMLLGLRSVSRARGGWHEVCGVPALATHHPATLIRRPEAKRDAWADLLALQQKLRSFGTAPGRVDAAAEI